MTKRWRLYVENEAGHCLHNIFSPLVNIHIINYKGSMFLYYVFGKMNIASAIMVLLGYL